MSFISLMAFWTIMSGYLDAIHLGMGVATVASVMYINFKLKSHRFFDDDMNDLKELRFLYAGGYIIWLLGQIVLAGFHVVSVIIRPKMPIHTTLVTFRADLPSAHARMILGNSITLTPGTLTIDIEGDKFTVHALDDKSHDAITSDIMPRKVLKLFEDSDREVIKDVKIINLTNKYTGEKA